MSNFQIKLKDWQEDAFNKWKENSCRGIIEAPTASGKTMLGIIGMHHFRTNTLIVVPKIQLMKQWKDEIVKYLGVDEKDIGFYFGEKKENKPIVIGVINSVRKVKFEDRDLIILDEIHNYASEENIKLLENNNFKYTMGLTATLERADDNDWMLEQFVGPVVYKMSQKDGIDNGFLNRFGVFNKSVELNAREELELQKVTNTIKDKWMNYGSMEAINRAAMKNDYGAIHVRRAITKRKQILHKAINKLSACIKLIEENKGKKIIVFNEFQEMADKLVKYFPGCSLYHSGMITKDKKNSIERFVSDQTDLLVSVKALDEGLNVKGAEVGIIIAGSTTKRQTVQRLGRLLRPKEGKFAVLYQLYVPDTKDEDWLKKRNSYIKDVAEFIKFI